MRADYWKDIATAARRARNTLAFVLKILFGTFSHRAPKKDREERLYHLMDGLLYPGVVGLGLVVLLMRVAYRLGNYGEVDTTFKQRLALGILTLVIYAASFMAFKDLEKESDYRSVIAVPDLLEVFCIFGCFYALGLLEPREHTAINADLFVKLLGLDLVILQPWWCWAASGDKKALVDYLGIRVLLVVIVALGFSWHLEMTAAGIAMFIVIVYEFWLRTDLHKREAWRKDLARAPQSPFDETV